MARFTNKVALITGGGTGIGRAVATALIEEGARVVVTGRREEPLAQLAAEFPDAVRYLTTDVTESGAGVHPHSDQYRDQNRDQASSCRSLRQLGVLLSRPSRLLDRTLRAVDLELGSESTDTLRFSGPVTT